MRDGKIAVVAARKVAQGVCSPLQPLLQPPLQDREVEQKDEVALAKDNTYVERDDILEVALANEFGLD